MRQVSRDSHFERDSHRPDPHWRESAEAVLDEAFVHSLGPFDTFIRGVSCFTPTTCGARSRT